MRNAGISLSLSPSSNPPIDLLAASTARNPGANCPGCNFRHSFHKSPALRCIRAGQAFGFVDQLQELTAVAEGIAAFGVAGELADHFPC